VLGVILAAGVLATGSGIPAALSSNHLGELAGVSVGSGPLRDAVPLALPSFPTPIRHVIVVMEENKEWSEVWQYGPNETRLATTDANVSQFFALRQASWPVYIAATSGYNPTVKDERINVPNLADLMTAYNETWQQWSESATGTCDTTDNMSGLYDTEHVGFIWYEDILGNSTECHSDVLPMSLSDMESRFASGNLSNYTFITPNIYNDGHSYSAKCPGGITNVTEAETVCADHWLGALLNSLMANKALFDQTAVFVTYDQTGTSDDSGGMVGAKGGHVYTSVVSPDVIPGYNSTVPYTDYNLVTTTEWLLGLPGGTLQGPLQSDNWTLHPPMWDLFYPSVSGTVTNATNIALSNATVSTVVGGVTESNLSAPNGSYSLYLPSGSYTLTASHPGYGPSTNPVTVGSNPVSGVNFTLKATPYTGPTVFSDTSFSVVSKTTGSSAPFASNRGDSIVVFVAIHGSKTVKSVTDSAKDNFTSSWYKASGTQVGISVWLAENVSGGPSVVVTMTGSSKNDATYEVLVVDVTGVSTNPLGHGPSLFSSKGKSGGSLSGSITAPAEDLVLAGFCSRGDVTLTMTGAGTSLDQGVAVLYNYDTTGGDAWYEAAGAGTVTMSASINLNEPWAEAVLALSGP